MISESVHNFGAYFNKGWLEYRKSVTLEGNDAACTEWKGEGAMFEDVLGRKFVDCLGGYGLLSLGWGHPEVVAAVRAQLVHSAQPSQELLDPLRGVLARLLANILPGDIDHAFFCNSGTEAVEGALKLAKLYTGKSGFISSVKGFHGKTLGSLSVSGKATFREPCGLLYAGPVYHVPYGDAAAVEQTLRCCEAVGVGIAAVIMEPVQGEAGAIVPPDDFWPRIRESTRNHGCLLIADEVQTGLGRTGKLFGVEHWNVVPDIITLGKALGGGVMPCAAFCSNARIWSKMERPNPFIHTTTTGGNPLAMAAAIAAIKVTVRDRLWEQAELRGQYLLEQLKLLQSRFPTVLAGATGKGLLIAMHFHSSESGYRVAANLFRQRVLVAGTLNSAQSIRLEPPLIVTQEQLRHVVGCLERAFAEVGAELEAASHKVETAPAVKQQKADEKPTETKPREAVPIMRKRQANSDEEANSDKEGTSSSSSSEDEEDKSDGDLRKPAQPRKYRKVVVAAADERSMSPSACFAKQPAVSGDVRDKDTPTLSPATSLSAALAASEAMPPPLLL
eukprot:TRINITY_DN2469_c0_g3_i2.p1 TRINITY_DN2469_c0_g3~~TRINITY_DN2469_c0_g3_i2.p1  ORF type:complete len:560 (+),score=154.82 TRINITY_DN2469_c0_g3_i2:381-2060(+)